MTKNVSNHEVNVEKWKFEGDTQNVQKRKR